MNHSGQGKLRAGVVMAAMGIAWSALIIFLPDHPLARFFWSGSFARTMQLALMAAAGLWVFKRVTGKGMPQRWIKWSCGILFLPVVIFPVFRCFFKVPYVFCRACPRPCPWGLSRTFLFSGFLALNLMGRSWCCGMCPFGTFQELQSGVSRFHFRLPGWTEGLAYLSLFAALAFYLATLFEWAWAGFFGVGRYDLMEWTAVAALIIAAVAFIVPKFWCRYFCPVGTIDSLIASFRKNESPKAK